MDRYILSKPCPSNIVQNEATNVEVEVNEGEDLSCQNNDTIVGDTNENVNDSIENEHARAENVNGEREMLDDHSTLLYSDDLFDPGNWKAPISQKQIDLLVERGPIRIKGVEYPIDKKRSFNDKYYTRCLGNMERYDRPWLVYSLSKNKVFCFCCVLFKKGAMQSPLTTAGQGYNDWHNLNTRLVEHELSMDHIHNLQAWREAEVRLKKRVTIDASREQAINKEKEYWRAVLKRIVVVVKTLATCNIAFRGDNERIVDENNGNFLKIINMIAEFDPIMEEHLRRIRKKEIRNHYLGHNIQNEMIQLLSNEVKKKILQVVKSAKYFSVILDCTPDVSHEEQMTLVLRCVNVSTSPIRVEEFFITFVKVVETTGEALFHELKRLLETHELDFNNVRGQGYDNGSNMKGDNKGVQGRVLREYPRAFYTPCGCHSLNLALCDMAMSCPQAKTFFGVVQRIYKLFSGSTKRWEVFKTYVKDRDGNGLTLKSWSDTRWESRVASVKAIRFQAPQIKQALEHLTKFSNDPSTVSDAKSISDYEMNFDFLVALVIWYEILNKVNKVSKVLQQRDMNMSSAISLLKGLIAFFQEYREDGFEKAKAEAEKIAIELDIEPQFREARVRTKKRFFDENANDEPTRSQENAFKVTYFLVLVDIAHSSLSSRFEQFHKYDDTFGFLYNLTKLKGMSDEDLMCSCVNLEEFLKHGDDEDIDARELLSELQMLRVSIQNAQKK
ncbi:unnamed protein product [Cuscuta epithymum]|uniref:TTF-type domain-containing protein n=2 Tax=Cuscuta epithymum TaxID=186058 RepID=A0AAV0EY31_9ASTE|nr:unnamed protein product [Cuscuta epithymum]